MFLTGRRITGEEALAWGLADVLVEPNKLREAATSLAAEIAENAPLAILSTRATIRKGLAEAVRSMILGSKKFIEKALVFRKALGGGMRRRGQARPSKGTRMTAW